MNPKSTDYRQGALTAIYDLLDTEVRERAKKIIDIVGVDDD